MPPKWSFPSTHWLKSREKSADLEEDGVSQDGWSLALYEGMQSSLKYALDSEVGKEGN